MWGWPAKSPWLGRHYQGSPQAHPMALETLVSFHPTHIPPCSFHFSIAICEIVLYSLLVHLLYIFFSTSLSFFISQCGVVEPKGRVSSHTVLRADCVSRCELYKKVYRTQWESWFSLPEKIATLTEKEDVGVRPAVPDWDGRWLHEPWEGTSVSLVMSLLIMVALDSACHCLLERGRASWEGD